MRLMLIAVLCSLMVSCRGEQQEKSVETLQENITKQLTEWLFITEVSVNKKQNNLFIDIKFKKSEKEELNSFFFDERSNDILMTMLNETFYNDFNEYEVLFYELYFDEPTDVKRMSAFVDKEKLDKVHHYYSQSPNFYDLVEYTFKNIRSVDVIRIGAWIEFLQKEDYLIDFEEGFWELLYEYSQVCSNSEEISGIPVYNFLVLANWACDPNANKPVTPEKLYYYINSCGLSINPEWIKLPFMEMIEKLNTHFKPD